MGSPLPETDRVSAMAGIATRPVEGSEDIQACFDLFFESFNDLHARFGVPLEDPAESDWLRTALTHLGRTDPGTLRLAIDDGAPVAFGAACRREGFWFLAFLFVAPRAQTRGVGRRLLEEILPPNEERAGTILATVVESIQPVSTGLYASFGMAPRTPWYTLEGLERPASLPELPRGVTAAPLTPELLDGCAALDRRLLGYTRSQDLERWLADAIVAMAYLDAEGTMIGYGLTDDGWLSPIASDDEISTAAIARDLLGRLDSPSESKLSVLGWSGGLIQTLLAAGMRLERYPYVYCSSDPARPHPAYVPYAPFLP
jgi:GNAT superfamily N-acetyltransferase